MGDLNMREVLYQTLIAYPDFTDRCPGGIYEIGSIISTQKPKDRPFSVLRLSFTQGRIPQLAKVAYAAVWVHDNPGTYVNIDAALVAARKALEAAPAQENFLQAKWLEDSIDFRDDDLGTIVRYCRFQLFHTTREG
jgi:hypothetical protein